ncbi:hypothetical protein CDAR_24951 [Caerostris darwini]|uniref:Uncharacterized protein n=1 Tax=Caerostris darwini TaxID=1538125 RepID=A0AAV4WIR9_9ARAC|nr:hypothetical protein CDAR_24951 [Caerostris darwini]
MMGILIEHQSNFRLLSEEQLRFYPNLEKLTVQNSGLSVITANAFAFTRRLREINVRHNKLSILHWRLFTGLKLIEL